MGREEERLFGRLSNQVMIDNVDGRLRSEFQNKLLIELDKELVPRAIQRPTSQEDSAIECGKQLGSLFDESERSLLVLGDPGNGKTIALLSLAEDLLERYALDSAEPIPIVVNLTGWSRSGLSIMDWVAQETLQIYGISDKFFPRKACDMLEVTMELLSLEVPREREHLTGISCLEKSWVVPTLGFWKKVGREIETLKEVMPGLFGLQ